MAVVYMHGSHLFAVNVRSLPLGRGGGVVCVFKSPTVEFLHLATVQVPDTVEIQGAGIDPVRPQCLV